MLSTSPETLKDSIRQGQEGQSGYLGGGDRALEGKFRILYPHGQVFGVLNFVRRTFSGHEAWSAAYRAFPWSILLFGIGMAV